MALWPGWIKKHRWGKELWCWPFWREVKHVKFCLNPKSHHSRKLMHIHHILSTNKKFPKLARDTTVSIEHFNGGEKPHLILTYPSKNTLKVYDNVHNNIWELMEEIYNSLLIARRYGYAPEPDLTNHDETIKAWEEDENYYETMPD